MIMETIGELDGCMGGIIKAIGVIVGIALVVGGILLFFMCDDSPNIEAESKKLELYETFKKQVKQTCNELKYEVYNDYEEIKFSDGKTEKKLRGSYYIVSCGNLPDKYKFNKEGLKFVEKF